MRKTDRCAIGCQKNRHTLDDSWSRKSCAAEASSKKLRLNRERELTLQYRSWLGDKHRINVVVKLKIRNFH